MSRQTLSVKDKSLSNEKRRNEHRKHKVYREDHDSKEELYDAPIVKTHVKKHESSPVHKKSKKNKKNESSEEIEDSKPIPTAAIGKLKEKILSWVSNDDKIKEMTKKMKAYKDQKKEQEATILKLIEKLDIGETKLDTGKCRVYRSKSVTKGAIKEDIIKGALLEVFKSEKQVDQLIKKIDSKRPVVERTYLKRTKGEKDGK